MVCRQRSRPQFELTKSAPKRVVRASRRDGAADPETAGYIDDAQWLAGGEAPRSGEVPAGSRGKAKEPLRMEREQRKLDETLTQPPEDEEEVPEGQPLGQARGPHPQDCEVLVGVAQLQHVHRPGR